MQLKKAMIGLFAFGALNAYADDCEVNVNRNTDDTVIQLLRSKGYSPVYSGASMSFSFNEWAWCGNNPKNTQQVGYAASYSLEKQSDSNHPSVEIASGFGTARAPILSQMGLSDSYGSSEEKAKRKAFTKFKKNLPVCPSI